MLYNPYVARFVRTIQELAGYRGQDAVRRNFKKFDRSRSISPCILYSAILVVILSSCAFFFNLFVYQFPGNNYFPPYTTYIGLSLFLMYFGSVLTFGVCARLTTALKEVIYFFFVVSVIAFATNAVQYTPFPTIDRHIISFEQSLDINIQSIVSWTNTKLEFKRLLEFIYDTLPYQMAYFPIAIIALRQQEHLREYYCLLFISAAIGFTIYYFFPTTAPASIIDANYFSAAQKATGLKFSQIHQHIQPTTLEGGMIAFPSFHVIWAWFCLYLIRGYPIAFMIMLPINALLIASCVLLGWHYPVDILGAIIVIITSHGLMKLGNNSHRRTNGNQSV